MSFPTRQEIAKFLVLGNRVEEQEEKKFKIEIGEKNPKASRVFLVGDSIAKKLCDHLDHTSRFSEVTHFSTNHLQHKGLNFEQLCTEVTTFLSSKNLGPHDYVILHYIGNSLIRTSEGGHPQIIHPHDPEGHGRFHLVGNCKAPTSEHLDEHIDNLVAMVDALQPFRPRILLLPTLPRFLDACCTNNMHFHSDFDGPQFNADLREMSHFLATTNKFLRPSGYSCVAIPLEKALGPGVWRGEKTAPDSVHAKPSALQEIADYIEAIHLEVDDDVLSNLEALEIPEEVKFSSWVSKYREINDLTPVAPPQSFNRLEQGIDIPPPCKAMRGKKNKGWRRGSK